jgi:putative sigma-54 modulation protein
MKVNITARHLELTSALKEYAEKKLLHARKFAANIKKGHIILNVEKDRHIAEIVVSVKMLKSKV